jgi:CRP/FNR family transcriptional regulator
LNAFSTFIESDANLVPAHFGAGSMDEQSLYSTFTHWAESAAEQQPGALPLNTSTHTIPARRTICHPSESPDFVIVICKGWVTSSISLSDGRRQILAFFLPGDIVSTPSLFKPISGRLIEAVTEVTYRKFKRSELKTILFKNPSLFEKVSKFWIEERANSDQLALDLGRRTADERIARLILNLAERLTKRGMVHGQTLDFPLRQRQIADATGLTPVHVGKVLGEFQRANLIEISNRSLVITNEPALCQIAGPK